MDLQVIQGQQLVQSSLSDRKTKDIALCASHCVNKDVDTHLYGRTIFIPRPTRN